MKKVYTVPKAIVVACGMQPLMADSGVTSDLNIDYGGVDNDGEREPESRRYGYEKYRAWEDDEDEEAL